MKLKISAKYFSKKKKGGAASKTRRSGMTTRTWKQRKTKQLRSAKINNLKRRKINHTHMLKKNEIGLHKELKKHMDLYSTELMSFNGIMQKVPTRYVKVLKNLKKTGRVDFNKLSAKFISLSKKTFESDLRTKNPLKFYKNILFLIMIAVVIKANFKKRSRGLGIPKQVKLEYLPNVKPFYNNNSEPEIEVPEDVERDFNLAIEQVTEEEIEKVLN